MPIDEPQLLIAPLMLARARASGAVVSAHRVGTATVLVREDSPTDVGNRAHDVDPREPGVVAAIVARMRGAGRRPLLEVDPRALDEASRGELVRLGQRRLWGVAELRRSLASVDEPRGTIVVRAVREDEAEAFGALAVRAFGDAPPGFPPVDRLAMAREWAAYRTLGLARCFFAELEGGPCAVGISLRIGDVALVDGAATLPEHRGRGCQSALLDHRFREARADGATVAVTRTGEGSPSQRNLERAGMTIARTLDVWGEPLLHRVTAPT